MARTKTNTQIDTKTRTTSWRNRHLEKLYFFNPFIAADANLRMLVMDASFDLLLFIIRLWLNLLFGRCCESLQHDRKLYLSKIEYTLNSYK